MIREKEMAYICSPLSAPTMDEIRVNMERARTYMQLISKVFRCRAVAPHAYLPELLDDRVSWERKLGLEVGMKLLEHSQALIVCSTVISHGMQAEIERARELKIPVYTLLKEDPYVGVVQTPSIQKEAQM